MPPLHTSFSFLHCLVQVQEVLERWVGGPLMQATCRGLERALSWG